MERLFEEGPDEATGPSRRPRVPRTIKFLLVAFVVYFFVLPLIPGFREAVADLNTIDPYLLIVGLGLQGSFLLVVLLQVVAQFGQELLQGLEVLGGGLRFLGEQFLAQPVEA